MVRQVGRTTKATDRLADTLQEKFPMPESLNCPRSTLFFLQLL